MLFHDNIFFQVRHVLEDKMDSGNVVDPNNIFESASSLLDAVMQYEDNKMQEEEEEQRHPPVEEEPSNLSCMYDRNI